MSHYTYSDQALPASPPDVWETDGDGLTDEEVAELESRYLEMKIDERLER